VAAWGGMIPPSQLWVSGERGFVGMLVDSVLGATVQRRGWMTRSCEFFQYAGCGSDGICDCQQLALSEGGCHMNGWLTAKCYVLCLQVGPGGRRGRHPKLHWLRGSEFVLPTPFQPQATSPRIVK